MVGGVESGVLAIVPLALINYALIGWMVPAEYDGDSLGFRYLWNMTVLIFLEAPLASIMREVALLVGGRAPEMKLVLIIRS